MLLDVLAEHTRVDTQSGTNDQGAQGGKSSRDTDQTHSSPTARPDGDSLESAGGSEGNTSRTGRTNDIPTP